MLEEEGAIESTICNWRYEDNFKLVYLFIFFFHETILSVKKVPNAKQATFTP